MITCEPQLARVTGPRLLTVVYRGQLAHSTVHVVDRELAKLQDSAYRLQVSQFFSTSDGPATAQESILHAGVRVASRPPDPGAAVFEAGIPEICPPGEGTGPSD
jgi:hypothetical protein